MSVTTQRPPWHRRAEVEDELIRQSCRQSLTAVGHEPEGPLVSEYLRDVRRRLEAGSQEYGQLQYLEDGVNPTREAQEEGSDVGGWTVLAYQRLWRDLENGMDEDVVAHLHRLDLEAVALGFQIWLNRRQRHDLYVEAAHNLKHADRPPNPDA